MKRLHFHRLDRTPYLKVVVRVWAGRYRSTWGFDVRILRWGVGYHHRRSNDLT